VLAATAGVARHGLGYNPPDVPSSVQARFAVERVRSRALRPRSLPGTSSRRVTTLVSEQSSALPEPDWSGVPPVLAEPCRRRWQEHREALADLHRGDWLASLPRVWACSDFVARTCERHPAVLVDLVAGGDLQRAYTKGELRARVAAALADVGDEAGLMRALRAVRRREMLRIAWRDLAGWADLAEVVAVVSELADASLDGALDLLYRWAVEDRGRPLGEESGDAQQLVVLGMGKLGGRELNFSSDIDLIFAYAEDGQTDGERPISNHEFFVRLGRRLIKIIGETTEDGFVFRVDMRLRPNGDSGPLSLSFAAMEHYYQVHGREWERYALIKARPVAGDQAAGRELLETLRPFVYRKYLDFGAVESLREMKALIQREVQRKGISDNIKLGPGGIREVEFITQACQLIRGGRLRELQDNRLRPMLAALSRIGMLTPRAAAELDEAYVFLRNCEHRLQMESDRQTQVLPHGEPSRTRLAYAMGFADWNAFHTALQRTMRRVHEHFEQAFVAPQAEAPEKGGVAMKELWLGLLDAAAAARILKDAGYGEPDEALNLLERLRGGSAYQSLSSTGRDRMDRLMPLLVAAAGLTDEPTIALQRLVNLVEAIGRRSVYLALLVENPMALSQLVRLCAASAWISSWIARHPILLDELLNPATLYAPPSREKLDDELRQWLARMPPDDLEAQMDALREFRHSHVLRVAAADVTGALGPEQVSDRLCGIAETVLRHALAVTWSGLVERYGEPRGAGEGAAGFLVVGYGKLGSYELGYTSDLDIIFLYEDAAANGNTDGASPVANEVFFARLAQRLLHMLQTRTPAGILYEVDTRLRPSGKSGTLVTSLGAFRSYQDEHAWTWEHQALVRARPVAGDQSLAAAFVEARREILCRPRDPEQLRRDVIEMRDRMIETHVARDTEGFHLKQERGGIVDIEFIVQYCVLRWAAEHPELVGRTDNTHILESLAELGLLQGDWTQTLIGAYRRYLQTEQQLKLMERPPMVSDDQLTAEREAVAAIWAELFGEGEPATAN
jgi:glutamate-ammonia-ligase adenylyltransferase